ncbi:hypothetical protein FBEOM_9767 [Fusarium beomiforme]|uniref:Uncharacterized protein n=1 Tax=Fusarium beomiforme TaxID=44412 RepID=A0A9P5ACM1_9HYPO|nr:hypothetical protein FBEOM_9767 [Fusarium beomiforme]
MHYLRLRGRTLRLRGRTLQLYLRTLLLRERTLRLYRRTLRHYRRRLLYRRLGFRHRISILRTFLDEKLGETIRSLRAHEEKVWNSKKPTAYGFDIHWRQDKVFRGLRIEYHGLVFRTLSIKTTKMHNDITITLAEVWFCIKQFFSEREDIYKGLEMDAGSKIRRPQVQRWRQAFEKLIFGGGRDRDQ